MIENTIKDNIIAIISYCDTVEKINVLIDNINLIKNKYSNFEIAIHANYPLPENIQKMVNHYFYEDLNVIYSGKMLLWNKLPYFNKKFIYSVDDYGFSVFQQIKNLSKYLIEYKKVLLMNYDAELEDKYIDNHMNLQHDLIVYDWRENAGFNMILMSFVPLEFSNKVSKFFNYDLYVELKDITPYYYQNMRMLNKLNQFYFHSI
jgi:hypothetical protein